MSQHRKARGMRTQGWSMSELARRLDMLPSNLGAMIHGRREVTHATAAKVADLYDELWDQPAPPSGRHGSVPIKARNYAHRAGWVPPLLWDDETIDDPTATPHVDETPTGLDSTRGTGRVNADSLTDTAIDWGMTMQQAADRLGVRIGSIDRALRRLDTEPVGGLRAAFHRNAIAQGLDRPTRDGLGLRRSA